MNSGSHPQGRLSLWDTTSIIVGIIIGSSIFRSLPLIAHNTLPLSNGSYVSPVTGLCLAWVLGGLAAWLGALCYAELATSYPEDGGTYVYLRRAFGRRTALFYAWLEFWIVRPGNVGAVAFVLGQFANEIYSLEFVSAKLGLPANTLWAMLAVGLTTLLNLGGVVLEKRVQNGLTLTKLFGLAAVIGLAFLVPAWKLQLPAAEVPSYPPHLALAMVLIMFAYGGWSDVVNVAAEVRDPLRNLSRSLFLGVGGVIGIYLVTNLSFITAFGFDGLRSNSSIAADLCRLYLGNFGSAAISGLIVISCLGAIHGMIFTTSRAFYTAGKDHAWLSWLAAWNEKREIPGRAVAVQGVVTLLLILLLGREESGFERLVVFTGPFFWFTFVVVACGLIRLRFLPTATRSQAYRAPLFPLVPLLFAASSGLMVAASLDYMVRHMQGYDWLWIVAVILGGLVLIAGQRMPASQKND